MPLNHLHILNGHSTESLFLKSGVSGDHVVWNTLLVEGPTDGNLRDQNFWAERAAFMEGAYGVEGAEYERKTVDEIKRLNDISQYYEVTLWFEYDLFCQVNMLACLSYIRHDKISVVCVGNEDGVLKGLGEHPADRYPDFFLDRVHLDSMDINYATRAWQAFACDEPHRLYPFINHNEHFPYLAQALKAHLKRFPNHKNGLNEQEIEILTALDQGVDSKHELIGHMLQWQDYYGFGDLQYGRMIDLLADFYQEDPLQLNDLGSKLLKKIKR